VAEEKNAQVPSERARDTGKQSPRETMRKDQEATKSSSQKDGFVPFLWPFLVVATFLQLFVRMIQGAISVDQVLNIYLGAGVIAFVCYAFMQVCSGKKTARKSAKKPVAKRSVLG